MTISVVIPTLDEAESISATLDAVARVGGLAEVIVVDGGSRDKTVEIAQKAGVRVITSDAGRGAQMHTGARVAEGTVLWFLHADTHPLPDASERIIEALSDPGVVGGNFEVRFDGDERAARFLSWLYPHLRQLGLCYGDSGIFVRREVYERVGGFRPFPIFEDLDLVRRIRRYGFIERVPSIVTTSSRRFEGRSFPITFTRWAALQMLYWMGVHPRRLAQLYAPIRGTRLRTPVDHKGLD